MYSHFRPVPPKGDHKTWKTIPTSGVLPTTMNEFIFGEKKYVSQDIDLEPYELFSQLQSIVSMVKVGPREGYFLSNVTIGEGLTRVWRNWLIERAECSTTKYCPEAEHKKRLLWASIREHIGLRFCIAQKTDVAGPILKSRDDDENVGYTLQYEGLSSILFFKKKIQGMLTECRTGGQNITNSSLHGAGTRRGSET
jgi:hypothetical protein